jgi:hypothetical protein
MKYLIVFFYIKCDTDNYRPIEEALCAVRYAAMLSPEADVVVLTERGPYEEAFKNECSAVFSFERQPDLKNAMGFQRVSALAHLQESFPTVPILSLDGDAFLVRNCAHVFDAMRSRGCTVAALPRARRTVLSEVEGHEVDVAWYMPYNNGVVFTLPEARLYKHVLAAMVRETRFWYQCQLALNRALSVPPLSNAVLNLPREYNYDWDYVSPISFWTHVLHAKGKRGVPFSARDVLRVYKALHKEQKDVAILPSSAYSVGCVPMGPQEEYLNLLRGYGKCSS